MRRVGLIAVVALAAAGCAKPWQAARTVVTASAEAVADADRVVAEHYEASGCPEEEDIQALEQCVANLADLVGVLELARATVLEGESLVDLWQRAQSQPDEWRGWLSSAGQVVARLAALLDGAGVDVPVDVLEVAELLDGILEGGAP